MDQFGLFFWFLICIFFYSFQLFQFAYKLGQGETEEANKHLPFLAVQGFCMFWCWGATLVFKGF